MNITSQRTAMTTRIDSFQDLAAGFSSDLLSEQQRREIDELGFSLLPITDARWREPCWKTM